MRRWADPGERWEMVTRHPHSALRPGVHSYRGFRLDFDRPRLRLEIPAGSVSVVIGFGEPLRIAGGREAAAGGVTCTSLVSGLHTRPSFGGHDGRAYGIEVVSDPWTAFRLLGTPMYELADTVVDLDQVLGSSLRYLTEALAETVGWAGRFTLLDSYLVTRLQTGPAVSAGVPQAWQRLAARQGRSGPAALAAQVGWSERTLERRFREQIGLPPKSVGRVLRFRHSLRLLEAQRRPSEIAALCGYYDQAHFNREFREMTTRSPSRFLAERALGARLQAQLDRAENQITSVVLTT
ncbi:helix-turn-helix domain-containing protein [Streptomyces sp. NPDC020983]|uniref:helix-turn-helix domain-containing protein n=1 Tax=Streptomyces sp. NPDC020983 TaxID=3365106 RepID=UPI0037A8CD63